MVLVLAFILYGSILGMLALIVIKRWELKTGRKLFASSLRPPVAHSSHKAAVWIKGLPQLCLHYIAKEGPALREWLRHTLAQALLWTERTLEQALHTLQRGTVPQESNAPVSDFLREVAEYKRKLASGMHRTHLKEPHTPR